MSELSRLRKVKAELSLREQIEQSQLEMLELDLQEVTAIHDQIVQQDEYEDVHQTYEEIKSELLNQQQLKQQRKRVDTLQENTAKIKQETTKKKTMIDRLKKLL